MTKRDDRYNPWTWEGAAYAQLRDSVLRTSASERVEALVNLLDLAEESGALNRRRQQEAEHWSCLWLHGVDAEP